MCIQFTALAAYVVTAPPPKVLSDIAEGDSFVYNKDGIFQARRDDPSGAALTVAEKLNPNLWPFTDRLNNSITLFRDYWFFVCKPLDMSPRAVALRAAIAAANTGDCDWLARVART